jgi:hypothetical protein
MENSADPHCVDYGAWHRFVERRMAMASDRVAPGRNWWDMLWLLVLVANRWNRCIVGSMGYWFINVDLNPGFHHRAICGSGAPRLEDRNEEPPITLVCLPRLFRICADSMCAYAAPNHPPKVIKLLFPQKRSFGQGKIPQSNGPPEDGQGALSGRLLSDSDRELPGKSRIFGNFSHRAATEARQVTEIPVSRELRGNPDQADL